MVCAIWTGQEWAEETGLAALSAYSFLFIFELALVLDSKSGFSSTEPPIVFGNFGNEIDFLAGRDSKSKRGFPVVVSYRQVTGTNYVHANENIAS